MTPERWREVEKIFHSVLGLAPERRAAYIAEACAGDGELQREVESLLAHNEEAEEIDFLDNSFDPLATKLISPNRNSSPASDECETLLIKLPTQRIAPQSAPLFKRHPILMTTSAVLASTAILISIWLALMRGSVKQPETLGENRTDTTKNRASFINDFQQKRIEFERISIEHGLSMNSVYSMLQDRQGFMWFGTQDGLNRYDGYKFTVFRRSPREKDSLSDNFITALFEDSDGILWVGTADGGLNRFDPAAQTFKHYRRDPSNPNSLASDHISAICNAGEKKLAVATAAGLNILNVETGDFTHFRHDDNNPASLSDDRVSAVCRDRDGALWIGTATGGLNRYDDKTRRFVFYRHDDNNPASISDNQIASIRQDEEGVLWVVTAQGGLNRYDPASDSFIRYMLGDETDRSSAVNRVNSVCRDRAGYLWAATFNGLYRLDLRSGEAVNYRHDETDRSSISNNKIKSMIADRAGIVWAGTIDGGLNKYDTENKKFDSLRIIAKDGKESFDKSISSIYKDRKGKIWIGTALNRLSLHNPADGTTRIFSPDSKEANISPDYYITSFCEWSEGELLIGGGRLIVYDLEKERFVSPKKYSQLISAIEGAPILTLYKDRPGNLWISTIGKGLFKYDAESRAVSSYLNEANSSAPFYSGRIAAVYEDRSGIMWFGTIGGGLRRLDPKTGDVKVYKNDPASPSSISSNRINSIIEDDSGVLWIGTPNGLNRYDVDSDSFASFTMKEGLPNDMVYGILKDAEGNLWLSTNNGLSKFDPKTTTFKNYDAADGLQSAEFNFRAFFKNDDGEMFFGGVNGVNRFYPDQIKENDYVPPVCITSVKTFDKTSKPVFSTVPVASAEPIAFPYNHNFFLFEFVALNYTRSEKNRYAYKLEGVNDDWIEIGPQRSARFSDLPPGEYVFKVIGSNNDGKWNREGASFSFSIAPPLWKTWPAYLSYLLLLSAAAYRIHRYRLRFLEERNRALEVKVAERVAEVSKKNKELVKKNEELVESHKRADRIFTALAEVLPGSVLDGKYRLDEKIGAGGFGAVYRAVHLAMNREVAVKIFKPAPGNDSIEGLERFKLEASSTCRVNHPNAVAVLDSGISSEGIAYLVMELLEGRTLNAELHSKRVLSVERCIEILYPVCCALSKAHAAGIIHRDIKPDNIFLHQSPEGETVKVVDFGIAKLIAQNTDEEINKLTVTGGLIGTPFYIAPERLAMDPYDGKSDVYSVGVLFYQMLCGQVPFPAGDGGLPGVIMGHMLKDPPSIRENNPTVTEELEKIVFKALEKDPAKRPTAAELANMIKGERRGNADERQSPSIVINL